MTNQKPNHFCKNCDEMLILVPDTEPYYECPAGCSYPECLDSELTAEELMERGKVDTCTEYGVISIWDWGKAIIL